MSCSESSLEFFELILEHDEVVRDSQPFACRLRLTSGRPAERDVVAVDLYVLSNVFSMGGRTGTRLRNM